MNKSKLKKVFDKIMNAYPETPSLICYTEAALITNPSPNELKRGFYKYVDKKDCEGCSKKEILKDTFGDMLDGKKSKPEERLYRNLWD